MGSIAENPAHAHGNDMLAEARAQVRGSAKYDKKNRLGMYQRKIEQELRCPLEYGISLLSGKWRSRIICMIGNKKPLRFGEIKSNLLNVTDGVLAATLLELTKMSLVEKQEDVSKGISEYRITEKGKSLIPILKSMCEWASQYYSDSNEVVMSQCLHCEFYKKWKNRIKENDTNQ